MGMRDIKPIPEMCRTCAAQLDINDTKVVGILSESLAEEYIKTTKRDSYFDKLCTEGYVVVPKNSGVLGDPICHFDWLANEQTIQIKGRPRTTENRSTLRWPKYAFNNLYSQFDEEAKPGIDYTTEDHRLWCQFFPRQGYDDPSSGSYNKLKEMIRMNTFLASLSKITAPHEHYACLARSTLLSVLGELELTKEVGKEGAKETIKLNKTQPVLDYRKLNLLVRGPSATSPQSLHTDSENAMFVCIVPLKTGPNGYHVRVGEYTHHRLSTHNYDQPIDYGKVVDKFVKVGECIVFAETLIHSGGKASKESTHQRLDPVFAGVFGPKYPGLSPTDIAFQVSTLHNGLSVPDKQLAFADVRPFKKHAEDEKQQIEFQQYLEKGIQDNEFRQKIQVAKSKFINDLLGIGLRSSDRVKRTKTS